MILSIVALIAMFGLGLWVGLVYNEEKLGAQQIKHKQQMDEMWEEVKRSRAHVADLIGKE